MPANPCAANRLVRFPDREIFDYQQIISRTGARRPAHLFLLSIDTKKNAPVIQKDTETEWDRPHGTRVEIELEAVYKKGRRSVDGYIAQTALVVDHRPVDVAGEVGGEDAGEDGGHPDRVVLELGPQVGADDDEQEGVGVGTLDARGHGFECIHGKASYPGAGFTE